MQHEFRQFLRPLAGVSNCSGEAQHLFRTRQSLARFGIYFFKEGFPEREAFLFFGHFFTSVWKYLSSPLNLTMTKGWLLPDFGNLSFFNKTNSLLRLRQMVQGLTQVKPFFCPGVGRMNRCNTDYEEIS
jgi:hypothetical protein